MKNTARRCCQRYSLRNTRQSFVWDRPWITSNDTLVSTSSAWIIYLESIIQCAIPMCIIIRLRTWSDGKQDTNLLCCRCGTWSGDNLLGTPSTPNNGHIRLLGYHWNVVGCSDSSLARRFLRASWSDATLFLFTVQNKWANIRQTTAKTRASLRSDRSQN